MFSLLFVSFVFGTYEDYEYKNEGVGHCVNALNQAVPDITTSGTGPNSCRVQCNHRDDCFGYNQYNSMGTEYCSLWIVQSKEGGQLRGGGGDWNGSSCMIKQYLHTGNGLCMVTGEQALNRPSTEHSAQFTIDEEACRWKCETYQYPDGRRCGGYNAPVDGQNGCIIWLVHPEQIIGPLESGYTDTSSDYSYGTLHHSACRRRVGIQNQDMCNGSHCSNNGNAGLGFSDWGYCPCNCFPGWTGTVCNQPEVCTASDCSNHGTASGNQPNCQCVCDLGWEGDKCQTATPCDDVTHCSDHGTASGLVHEGCSCSCTPEWMGEECETPTCPNAEGASCGGNDFEALMACNGELESCCQPHLECQRQNEWHSECLAECPAGWDCNIISPEQCAHNEFGRTCSPGNTDPDLCCGVGLECVGDDSYAVCESTTCPGYREGSSCGGPAGYAGETCCPSGTQCFVKNQYELHYCHEECPGTDWDCFEPVPPFGMAGEWTCELTDFTMNDNTFSFTAPVLASQTSSGVKWAFVEKPEAPQMGWMSLYPGSSYWSPDGSVLMADQDSSFDNNATPSLWMLFDNAITDPVNQLDFYFCYQE